MYYLFITILPANVRVFRYVAKDFASFLSFFSHLLSFSALFTGMKSCLPMLVALLMHTDRHSFFCIDGQALDETPIHFSESAIRFDESAIHFLETPIRFFVAILCYCLTVFRVFCRHKSTSTVLSKESMSLFPVCEGKKSSPVILSTSRTLHE